MNDFYDANGIQILEDNESPNPLYGMEAYLITPDNFKSLLAGKRLYIAVNDEYAVILKLADIGPNLQLFDVQKAYYKGMSDGFEKCVNAIKEFNERK